MPPCTTQPPKSHYLDRATLAELVRAHRATGTISEDLGRALMLIASGVWDRYRFTQEKEDFVGEAVLHLLGSPIRRADPAQNLFSYFTTCAIRHGNKLRNKAGADRRRFTAYAQDLVDSGEELPERE